MSDTSGATSAKTVSFVAPFRHPAFAVIWTATLVSNVGGWMYSAASGWLMTSLDPDPLIVALVQAASTLPIFLLALPAGALADIFDKRKYLLVVESLYTALAAVYAAMVGPRFGHTGQFALVYVADRCRGRVDRAGLASGRAALVPKDDLPPALPPIASA